MAYFIPKIVKLLLSTVTFFFLNLTAAQALSDKQLEQKVHQCNSARQYTKSQQLLLPVLLNETNSSDARCLAAILLSDTYRQVSDYQSTLKYLRIARAFATRSARKLTYIATIRAQEAFTYFDSRAYKQADQIMQAFERTGFNRISLEDRAKLVMQQGYLHFLDKQYKMARIKYQEATTLMQTSSPRDLPLIQVKQMQLFAATRQPGQMNGAFRQAVAQADRYHSIKYRLYAYNELRAIYKEQHNRVHFLEIQHQVDSLNDIYAQNGSVAALHNQKERIVAATSIRQRQQQQARQQWFDMGLLGTTILLLVLLGRSQFLQVQRPSPKQQQLAEKSASTTSLGLGLLQKQSVAFSYRQLEILDCIHKGMGNKQIAECLCISENTVKYHVKNIYQLLNVNNRKELFLMQG